MTEINVRRLIKGTYILGKKLHISRRIGFRLFLQHDSRKFHFVLTVHLITTEDLTYKKFLKL
jgi:hypothetical protein